MRTIAVKVYDFEELSDSAKEKAFEDWLAIRQGQQYSWADEITKIVKAVEESSQIRVEDLSYDTQSYNYRLGFKSYHGMDDDKVHMTGLRASKAVMAIYYDLTHQNQFYRKSKTHEGKFVFEYYPEKYRNKDCIGRKSVFYKTEDCFTGYCESETFTSALIGSVKENTKNDFTIMDHFEVAFDKLFASVVSDCESLESEAYFLEVDANQYEYHEDGEVFED